MYATPNDIIDVKRYYSVKIGAKTEHPLQFLKPFLNDKWEHVAV
jgi:hypothetical protein